MTNGRKPETGSEQGQHCFIFRAPAWMPGSTSVVAFPQLPLMLCTHVLCVLEHSGVWQVLLFSFTVFLFSPESLLLESSDSSVAVDFCFNFCSQFTGFLLLWADFLLFWSLFLNGYSFPALASVMAIWFSFSHSNICSRDLENELPLAASE